MCYAGMPGNQWWIQEHWDQIDRIKKEEEGKKRKMEVTYYVDTETARFIFYRGNRSEDEITELNRKISVLISEEI